MTRLFGFNQGTGTATKNLNTNTGTNKPIYRVNSDGRAKPLPKLITKNNSVENRTKAFLNIYWHNYDQRKNNAWNIKPEVLVCIAWADSHLWYALKSKNNIWNVWNNDRWDIKEYETLDQGIRAIRYTLNWTYLKNKQTIWDLSFAWDCKIDCKYVYATSNQNWQNNVTNCLSLIYNKTIEPSFTIKNK